MEYTVVIGVDSLHITYGEEDITVNAQTDSFEFFTTGNGWRWKDADGETWNIKQWDDDGQLNLYCGGGESEGKLDVYLDRQADGDATECKWTEYIGTWSYTEDYVESEDEVYTVVISEDGFEVSCCDVSFTVAAKDINFDPKTGFTWTHEGLDYHLEIETDGTLKFYDDSYKVAPEVGLSREA